jgi:hypothetical protein
LEKWAKKKEKEKIDRWTNADDMSTRCHGDVPAREDITGS